MLVVISPAKRLDFETPKALRKHTMPDFVAESSELASIMRRKKPGELRALMGISDKLAEINHARFKTWSAKSSSASARQAILAFTGEVYLGLDARSLTSRELDYAQSHLRILSGLYGLLRPLDLIEPYRLQMGAELKTSQGRDLYAFWGPRPALALKTQAAAIRSRHLVNLASHEYFKAVDLVALGLEVITPVFKDRQGTQHKVLSFFAKKARGTMARYILQTRARKPDDLYAFRGDGYSYDAGMSTPTMPVFTRADGGKGGAC